MANLDDSYVQVDSKMRATAYIGEDATKLASVIVLRSAINMYFQSCGRIIPTRGITISGMLLRATQTTQKQYKRSPEGQLQAIKDLDEWISLAKCSMPIVVR